MSRSIHTTRRTVADRAAEASTRPELGEQLEKAQEEKRRKRKIKRSVKEERRVQKTPTPGSVVEQVPINILDNNPSVIHGATEADLRAVLSRLPHAAREGISRIQLSLGKSEQEEIVLRKADRDQICDPICHRPGNEIIPGVYGGIFQGSYTRSSGLISVFAFVVDEAKVCVPPPALTLFLKLHALKTFVHEVAHHHDNSARVRRGRWLADGEDRVEDYASKMENEWTRSAIIPYLETEYPEPTEAFLSWIEHSGGIRLKLGFFGGDARKSKYYGRFYFVYSPVSLLEAWVGKFGEYSELLGHRIGFAEQLHYAEYYDECLKILNGVISVDARRIDALTWKADTLVHLEKWSEAEEIVGNVLKRVPTNEHALEVRGNILEERKEWNALLENSKLWLASAPEESTDKQIAVIQEAVAYCALGNLEMAEDRIKELVRMGYPVSMNNPTRLRKNIFRRAGRELITEIGQPQTKEQP
jgi:hypothetical protein